MTLCASACAGNHIAIIVLVTANGRNLRANAPLNGQRMDSEWTAHGQQPTEHVELWDLLLTGENSPESEQTEEGFSCQGRMFP